VQVHEHEVPGPRAAELIYGLHSTFLLELDDEQRLRIFDLAARASRELHKWAARYPLMRRVRVWPVCLSVAAAAHFTSADIVVNMARMSLWIFTIDDLFDEEIVPFAELRRRIARYNDILAGARADQRRERDKLALALQGIRDDLSTAPLFPVLWDKWAEAVSGTLGAMMREHEWRILYRSGSGDAQLPSYDSYLSYGIYSIGGPPVIWTSLVAISDESTLEHLPRLKQLEHTASLCLRLSNDLRSRSKEIAEGNVNSIVIRQHEAMERGHPSEVAQEIACATVQEDIRRGLARCQELQRQARTRTGYPERVMTDIARFVCDFYVHHDYHTFTAGVGRP
jgi:hypothetical protein